MVTSRSSIIHSDSMAARRSASLVSITVSGGAISRVGPGAFQVAAGREKAGEVEHGVPKGVTRCLKCRSTVSRCARADSATRLSHFLKAGLARAHSAHGAPLNYRHLYYFWVVAKEGGMARAAARLDMAVQTISEQVRLLEQSLGHALFKPAGRGIALTEAGAVAMAQAEQIFQLGEQLPAAVRDAATGQGMRLAVGISDGLPKLVVRHLLQPALGGRGVRLLCQEDEFERLLGDLALHRLDVVLSDRAAPPNPNLRLYSHPLGECRIGLVGAGGHGEEIHEALPGVAGRHARPAADRPFGRSAAAGPMVRAAGPAAAGGGRIRGQRLAGRLRPQWHGGIPGLAMVARGTAEGPGLAAAGRQSGAGRALLPDFRGTPHPASAGAALAGTYKLAAEDNP